MLTITERELMQKKSRGKTLMTINTILPEISSKGSTFPIKES